jgi:ribosome-binding factor A
MPSSKRIEKLTKLILKRAGEVVSQELKDPRLGIVTITRVDLTADLRHAKIFWSVLGDESERNKSTYALEHARGHIQSEIAHIMHTRVTPILSFHYDESIEGVIRVSRILNDLRQEREAIEEQAAEADDAGQADGEDETAGQ